MSTVLTDDEVQRNIASNICRLLKLSGMTQRDLADKIGHSQAAVSLICAGQRMPGAGTLLRISEALGVRMDRLAEVGPEKVSA